MVEYSAGYKAKAEEKLKALEKSMDAKARVVAKGMLSHFEKSSTKNPRDNKAA